MNGFEKLRLDVFSDTAAEPAGDTAAAAGQPAGESPETGENAPVLSTGEAGNPHLPELQVSLDWEQVKSHPELGACFRAEVQDIVKRRLGQTRQAQERLEALQPVLRLLEDSFGPTDSMDADALALRLQAALAGGDSPKSAPGSGAESADDTAPEETAAEAPAAAAADTQAEAAASGEQAQAETEEAETGETADGQDISSTEFHLRARQRLDAHMENLRRQERQLQQLLPGFSLERELMQSPQLLRLTAPGTGLSLESAYIALNWRQLTALREQRVAAAVEQALSRSLACGQGRPPEMGGVSQPGAVQPLPYSKLSAPQRQLIRDMVKSGG